MSLSLIFGATLHALEERLSLETFDNSIHVRPYVHNIRVVRDALSAGVAAAFITILQKKENKKTLIFYKLVVKVNGGICCTHCKVFKHFTLFSIKPQ